MYQHSLALRLARWLLPWLCVLGISTSLAYAADLGLERAFSTLPSTPAETVHVIDITVRYDAGPTTEMRCFAHPGPTTVDRMEVRAAELREIAVSMCSRLELVVP